MGLNPTKFSVDEKEGKVLFDQPSKNIQRIMGPRPTPCRLEAIVRKRQGLHSDRRFITFQQRPFCNVLITFRSIMIYVHSYSMPWNVPETFWRRWGMIAQQLFVRGPATFKMHMWPQSIRSIAPLPLHLHTNNHSKLFHRKRGFNLQCLLSLLTL